MAFSTALYANDRQRSLLYAAGQPSIRPRKHISVERKINRGGHQKSLLRCRRLFCRYSVGYGIVGNVSLPSPLALRSYPAILSRRELLRRGSKPGRPASATLVSALYARLLARDSFPARRSSRRNGRYDLRSVRVGIRNSSRLTLVTRILSSRAERYRRPRSPLPVRRMALLGFVSVGSFQSFARPAAFTRSTE